MAFFTQAQPPIIVDTEAERSTTWPNGSIVFCKDTLKTYFLIDGVFRPAVPASESSSVSWGGIQGTLSNQTDLQTALDAKPTFTVLVLGSDIATGANTTPVNLTGMSFSFAANSKYVIDMYMIQQSAAATTGFGYQIDTSVAVTSVMLTHVNQLANTGTLTGSSSIGDAAATGVSSGLPGAATNVPVMGSGLLVTGANAGTAQFQVRSETTAVTTCKSGSIIRIHKVA